MSKTESIPINEQIIMDLKQINERIRLAIELDQLYLIDIDIITDILINISKDILKKFGKPFLKIFGGF